MSTKLEIINQSLILLGEKSISDLSLPVGEVMTRLYDDVREDLLTDHRWRFAMKKVALSEAAGSPVNEWKNHFTLPTDMLMLITTYPTSNYEIYEDKLLTENESVSVDYLYDPGEKKYPTYFVRVFTHRLAAIAALAVTNDKKLEELMEVRAKECLGKARFKDSQGRPSVAIKSRPFIDVRS